MEIIYAHKKQGMPCAYFYGIHKSKHLTGTQMGFKFSKIKNILEFKNINFD